VKAQRECRIARLARSRRRRRFFFVALAIGVALSAAHGRAADKAASEGAKPAASPAAKFTTEKLRGKVVWLEDALRRRYGVATEPDAAKTSVVLEMSDGTLLPILPDTRGRSFAVDERLRGVELVLLVRRYEKVPLIQVIRVMRPTADGLLEVDYWCDTCAIPMYILKPCECCQGETRLRERPLDEVFEPH
jgi:hypothetical protein